MILLLLRIELSHFDDIVAAHSIVRILRTSQPIHLSDQWVGSIR
jgi:hypothetical protein